MDNGCAHRGCVHGLGEDLQRHDVVVAIYDEAGQKIGFAEDDAVGVGILDKFCAVGDGGANALRYQCGQIGHGTV